jgi:2-enoate reductase
MEGDKLSYFPRIDRSRTNIAGWRDLSYAVHSYGSKIFIQLTAGLGRVGNPECLTKQLKLPVSASFNPNYYIPAIPCMRLSDAKIKKIVKKTGQAAVDAQVAGLDGVYLHGHEGYLIEQLTNSAFNRRKLGRYADPMQFGIDMVKNIRARCGKNFPIMYRIDLSLALNATYGSKMNKVKSLKKFRGERAIETTLEYMDKLVEAGVDMFDVDLGCYDNWWLPHPPATMPSGCFVDIAEIAKKHFEEKQILTNAGQKVAVVAVGKLGYPDLAESVLRENTADMVMLARPLLADPDWANKAYMGDTKHITPCIGCHEGCIKEFLEGGHPQCAVCPRTAFEDVDNFVPAKKVKRIAVVGAGPAGVVASKTLLARGHKVDLYEKDNAVGGVLRLASVAKNKYELRNYVEYLATAVEDMKQNPNFAVHFGTTATMEMLKQQQYDAIIFATGSSCVGLNIDGAVLPHVHTVIEALEKPEIFDNANSVAIVGGGDSGCELAYMLAYERNKKVTILESAPTLMTNTCTANRGHILHYLEKIGVKTYNCAKVQKIEEGYVNILANVHKSVPNPNKTWEPILPKNVVNPLEKKIKEKRRAVAVDADVVIFAAGTHSNNDLYYQAYTAQIAPEIYAIGDARQCGKVFGAVKDAYNLCRGL